MFGSMYFLTQYLQFVLGYTPMVAGAALIPLAGAMMIVSPNTAKLTKRLGTKIPVAAGMVIVALALALMSRITVSDELLVRRRSSCSCWASASRPPWPRPPSPSWARCRPGKAGVGSAMNDTTRQVGGALGVAVLGSLTAAAYHEQFGATKSVAALPPAAAHAARDSIGGAVEVAEHMGAAGQQLVADASASFVHAMSTTLLIAAVVALGGAVVALIFLPARPPDAAPEPDLVDEIAEEREADLVAQAVG